MDIRIEQDETAPYPLWELVVYTTKGGRKRISTSLSKDTLEARKEQFLQQWRDEENE